MREIRKILLPLDLEETALPLAVIRQAAALAHHFHSEIIVLHVIRPLAFLSRREQAHELIEQAVTSEQEKLGQSLGQELDGLSVRSLVFNGDPGREILRAVTDEKIDLVVMRTHDYGDYERILAGSVTGKVLHNGKCAVWVGAPSTEDSSQPFAIRNILCPVDFSTHSSKTIRWAQEMATEFGARLTLAHATPGVEIYGPGGSTILQGMKRELINGAKAMMDQIQQELGIKAEVFIGCGNPAKIMAQATQETKADLLVVGSRASEQKFGNTAYAIIREARVPVLSV